MDLPPRLASNQSKQGGFCIMVIITDECIECGSCVEVCPEGAIQEGDGKYVIDQELCIECLSCLDECPNEAIVEQ
jgi:NAD-dependent dihydropyrimidine dehydrogenase PreA subunit